VVHDAAGIGASVQRLVEGIEREVALE